MTTGATTGSRSDTRWRFPAADTIRLDNGLRLRLVDMPGRLVATVAISITLPTEVETPDTEGAVAAYSLLLPLDPVFANSSATGLTARIGAGLAAGCDHRGVKVLADCPVSELGSLCQVLAPAVFTPRPDLTSFQVVRNRRLAEIDNEQHDPFGRANALFNEAVLDPGSRYARPVAGNARSWQTLTLDDVLALHDAHVDPQHVTVTVVGDLGGAAAERSACLPDVVAAFQGVVSGGRAAAQDRPPTPRLRPTLQLREGRDSAQTQLLLGCWAIDRRDPRWPSARVLAELLGGGTDGLIDRDLRSRRGLTYGMDVRFLPYAVGGTFVVSGKVDADRSAQAADAVRAILAELPDGCFGGGGGAVDAVRERMVVAAPQIFESTLAVAQQYTELDSCDLPEWFIDDHLDRLRGLSTRQVLADARELLDPAGLHVVAIGRFDAERSQFRDLPRS